MASNSVWSKRELWFGLPIALGILVFIGWLIQQYLGARTKAEEAVSLLRDPERSDASRAELFDESISDLSDASLALLIDEISKSRGALHTEQTGFSGTWPIVPFSCFSGELTGSDRFWLVVTRRNDRWAITTLSKNERPKICEYEH